MFYHLKGTVAELGPNLVVMDCAGIGFALNATVNTISRLKSGESAKLYVSEAIGENNFDLYGFYEKSEKRCFEMLISVSGIGPKAALSILSYNTPEGLALSVLNNDVKALTVAPGIGKKIAQRVILELKDKMQKQAGDFAVEDTSFSVPTGTEAQTKMSDAASALAVLGYSSSECAAALKDVDMSMPLESIIRAALRNMMK